MPDPDETRQPESGKHRPVEEPTTQYPVVSDQPIEVRHPRAKLRLVSVLFAVSIVLLSGSAGYLGYQLSARHTDARLHALEDDLAQRRAARAKQDAAVRALLEQYREAMCALIERTPPDPEIDRQRVIYQCGPYRPAAAGSSPGTGAPGSTPAVPRTPAPNDAGGTGAAAPRSTPSRLPAQPSAPPTPPPTHLLCVLRLCIG